MFCFDFMVAFFGSAADWDLVFTTLRASPLNNIKNDEQMQEPN